MRVYTCNRMLVCAFVHVLHACVHCGTRVCLVNVHDSSLLSSDDGCEHRIVLHSFTVTTSWQRDSARWPGGERPQPVTVRVPPAGHGVDSSHRRSTALITSAHAAFCALKLTVAQNHRPSQGKLSGREGHN